MNWPDQTVPLPISSALHLVFKLYHDKLKRIYDVVLCRMPEMHLTSLSKEYELFADYEYFLFQHDFYPTKIFKEFQLKLDPRNSFYMIALSNPFPKEIMTLLELFLAIPLLFAPDHLLLSKNVSSESLFFFIWKHLEAKIPCRIQNFMRRMQSLLKKIQEQKIHYWDFVYLKQKYLIIKSHFHNFYWYLGVQIYLYCFSLLCCERLASSFHTHWKFTQISLHWTLMTLF